MNEQKLPLRGLRCPNCQSRLRQTVENLDEDRYINVYECSNCEYQFRHTDTVYDARPRKKIPLRVSIKKSLARFSGDIGENIAEKFLVDQNFRIWSFETCLGFLDTHFEIKYNADRFILEQFFDEKHLQNFINYCKAWSTDPDVPSGTISKARFPSAGWRIDPDTKNRSSNFGPDFIGEKEGKFYIIEVKVNTSPLQKYQKKMLLRSKDFDFTPLVVRVKINIEAPIEKISIKKL
jgi:hypothetical protein